MTGKCQVHQSVLSLIYRTCRTIESHSTAFLVKECRLTDILFLSVKRHDVTRGRQPQRQSRRHILEIGQTQHIFMRDGVGTPVSSIIHHQRSLLHLLFDESRHVRITVSRRRTDSGVGIPHNTLYLISRIELFYHSCDAVSILHMSIVITIVTHKAKQVLPSAGIIVIDVAFYLVHHASGIVSRSRRDTSYSHISLCRQHIASFAVVHQTEIVVRYIAVSCTRRVLTLIAEQKIVR